MDHAHVVTNDTVVSVYIQKLSYHNAPEGPVKCLRLMKHAYSNVNISCNVLKTSNHTIPRGEVSVVNQRHTRGYL